MTLIAALQGVDGIVLAADSRGTIGDPRGLTAINDTQTKLFRLSTHTGVTIAGSSELAYQALEVVRNQLQQNAQACYIDEVMPIFRNSVRRAYNDWFSGFPIDKRPGVNFILAGATSQEQTADLKIFVFSSQLDYAPQLASNGYMLAGVPNYAIYLLHRLYSKDMTTAHLQSLAAYVISETATQDPKVGGPIRIAEISGPQGFVEIADVDIESIIRRNEEQNRRLREFFFRGDG